MASLDPIALTARRHKVGFNRGTSDFIRDYMVYREWRIVIATVAAAVTISLENPPGNYLVYLPLGFSENCLLWTFDIQYIGLVQKLGEFIWSHGDLFHLQVDIFTGEGDPVRSIGALVNRPYQLDRVANRQQRNVHM